MEKCINLGVSKRGCATFKLRNVGIPTSKVLYSQQLLDGSMAVMAIIVILSVVLFVAFVAVVIPVTVVILVTIVESHCIHYIMRL